MEPVKSVYLHIPFCETICSYCDFCKVYYRKEWVDRYLDYLKQEVKEAYRGERMSTIYIGGGTPSSLSLDQLQKLANIVALIHREDDCEFTFECNLEHMTAAKLELLKKMGVTRISYGIQTFHPHYLTFLHRQHTFDDVQAKIKLTKQYFQSINVDFMYAFPGETIAEVEADLQQFLKLEVPHISTYSLIIEPHTLLAYQKVDYIDDVLDAAMYACIETTLKRFGYRHYEVSNYAKQGYESQHNLTYWNNQPYYGFGLSASGYLDGIRYENTHSITRYLQGKRQYQHHLLSKQEQMENEMILGLRKLDGVSLVDFESKYHVAMTAVFPIENLIEEGKLELVNNRVRIPDHLIYLSNDILIQFIGEA